MKFLIFFILINRENEPPVWMNNFLSVSQDLMTALSNPSCISKNFKPQVISSINKIAEFQLKVLFWIVDNLLFLHQTIDLLLYFIDF